MRLLGMPLGCLDMDGGRCPGGPEAHLGHVGHEVVGDAVWVFSNAARRVRADGVEVAQHHHRPARVRERVRGEAEVEE